MVCSNDVMLRDGEFRGPGLILASVGRGGCLWIQMFVAVVAKKMEAMEREDSMVYITMAELQRKTKLIGLTGWFAR